MWEKYSPYFKALEFSCKCGCLANGMSEGFMDRLLVARKIAGIPFVINSGYRCLEHNRIVGGEDGSDHVIGKGCDIKCNNSKGRMTLVKSLLSAGFNRIGIAKSFIHVGYNEKNPQDVIWVY